MSSNTINTAPTDSSNNKKQEILSEYTLKNVIGKGTFSIVKLGENKATKEKVAIKIMQKSKIINNEDLLRIHREIEMLKRLNHPNVIKILKIQEDSKKFYIIMEYCENGELFNRIVEKQRLNEDESAYFYYQIICGLEYIHKNDIAHRDLKPENLLLSKNDILKIIDFGLSNYSYFNFLLGTPCGSPCYASPEMVSGKKYNGFLIDVWSTGIILFAMICGYLPFEDNDNEVLFGKILKCKINYPKHIGELPLDLMKKIIVPDPNKRITLNQIKQHPFYLKGKLLFSQKHPEINYNKIKEIPILKSKSMRNKEKKDSYKNKINSKYSINLDNISNNYQRTETDNIDYDIFLNEIKFNNKKISEKENIDSNIPKINSIEKYKLDSNSSNLNSDEIPMDSVPKEFNSEREEIASKNSPLNTSKIGKKLPKDEKKNSNKNTQRDNNNYANIGIKAIKNNNTCRKKQKEIKIKKEELNNKKIKSKENSSKKPRNNVKKVKNLLISKNKDNNVEENIVVEYCKTENSSTTLGLSTATNSNGAYLYNANTNYNNDVNKSRYSVVTHKVPKTSYINNKTNAIYEGKNKIIKNEVKSNYLSNSIPKNNYKNNFNANKKYPHNNHNKTNNISSNKKIENISKYNISNLNNTEEKNVRYKTEYSVKVPKMIQNYKINNRLNAHTVNTSNKEIRNKNINDKINHIYNGLQSIQKNKKKNNGNNLINIFENLSLSAEKAMTPITMKVNNLEKIQKKENESFNLNKYIQNLNRNIKSKNNNIDIFSERSYIIPNNLNSNNKKINEKLTTKVNNKIPNNPNNYIRDNTTVSYDLGRSLNNKYFENITINNNNSINLHEPKLYIYVENNNNTINNNEQLYDNLKTYNYEYKNKQNAYIKNDKKIYSEYKFNNNKKNINNKIEQNNKLLNKKLNANIIDTKTNTKYNSYNSNEGNKPKRTIAIFNEYNKNLLDMFRKKSTINKKAPTTAESPNFNFKNTISMPNRNRNTTHNSINNYILNSCTLKNNNDFFNNYDYITSNQINHNLANTEINLGMWTYDNERLNTDQNNYYINSNSKNLRTKNTNFYNNYILSPNPLASYDNLDYKIKLQRLQKKNNILNNNIEFNNNSAKVGNENYRNLIPKSNITTNIDNYGNYRKLNTIECTYSPISKSNYPNLRNYKKFVKQYNAKK